MRASKTVIVLTLVTAVVAAAAFLTPREQSTISRAGEPLFPELEKQLQQATKVVATSAGEVVNLVRERRQR